MLNIDSLQNGIVIDHIKAGASMIIYDLLQLGKLDFCVAIIKNARSEKYGKKDIIKIDGDIDIDFNMLGFLDPNITVCVIRDGKIQEKKKLTLPKELHNVIKCKNPRCITSAEESIEHIFVLGENNRYRCAYCEQEYDSKTAKQLYPFACRAPRRGGERGRHFAEQKNRRPLPRNADGAPVFPFRTIPFCIK